MEWKVEKRCVPTSNVDESFDDLIHGCVSQNTNVEGDTTSIWRNMKGDGVMDESHERQNQEDSLLLDDTSCWNSEGNQDVLVIIARIMICRNSRIPQNGNAMLKRE